MSPDGPRRRRHLVLHDYGMGGSWWWVRADVAEDIVDAFAEVEVVTDPDTIAEVATWDGVEEIELGAATLGSLTDFAEQRAAERRHPDHGRLAGRDHVYLREEEDGDLYLCELGPDGRRLRAVDLTSSDDPLRSGSWLFNPPYDLRSPALVPFEISAEEFEAHWDRARPDPDAWDEGAWDENECDDPPSARSPEPGRGHAGP